MQKSIFFKIGFLCGLIPLFGGLIIYFSWVISRNIFGFDLYIMTEVGLYWIVFSIPVAFIGLLLLILFILKNKKQYLTKSILCIILIFINIPVVYCIFQRFEIIADRAYLKIYNRTNQNNIHIVFKGSYYYKDLGELNMNCYKVVYFNPKYSNLSNDNIGIVDSFFLEIKNEKDIKKVLCPPIYQKDFMKLELNEKLQLILH